MLTRRLFGFCVSVGVLLFCVSPAMAAVSFTEGVRFGGGVDGTTGGDRCPENPGDVCTNGTGGSGAGSFNLPVGVAVDQATGSVYIADVENQRVDEFDSTGHFVSMFGADVDATTGGNVCPEHPGDVCQAGTSGDGNGQFSFPEGVAVDSSGDVYVVDSGNDRVEKFDSTGHFILAFSGGGGHAFSWEFGSFIAVGPGGNVYIGDENGVQIFEPSGTYLTEIGLPGAGKTKALAVDSGGDIYVKSANFTGVHEYSPLGVEISTAFDAGDNSIYAVALAPSGDLYVRTGSEILAYSPSRVKLISFGSDIANSEGIAYGGTDNALYVSDFGHQDVQVFVKQIAPEVATEAAVGVEQGSATLRGTVNPEGAQLTSCRFEYGTTISYGHSASCVPAALEVPADSSAHVVTANITGLARGTTYHFHLAAGNAQASEEGTDKEFVTVGPVIDGAGASKIRANTATLLAQINPFGKNTYDTTYHFEYGTSASYGTSVPIPDANIGSGEAGVAVSQEVTSLQPNMSYHYRVVATNSFGSIDGPDGVFTTEPTVCPNEAARQGPSAGLPDCRAYEQVTPVDKGIAEDMFGDQDGKNYSVGYPSEDGEHYLLTTVASLGADGASGENRYVFTRTPEGWSTTSLVVEGRGVQSLAAANYLFDSTDFSMLAFRDLLGSAAAGERELAFVGPPGGPYVELPESVELAGGSSDLSHLVLESQEHSLAPGDSGQVAGSALYEWSAGQLRLVNLSTAGSLVSKCGAILGLDREEDGGTHNAVSSDGSKIFFTAPDPRGPEVDEGCWGKRGTSSEVNPPQLYMRVDGTATVNVSAPNPGVVDSTGPHAAVYVGASADGSKVFFMSKEELTADDTTHAPELYEYDTETSTLTRVSRGDSGAAEGDVDFVGAISNDGSNVYFTAHGQLAPGVPALEAEQVYLYRYDTLTGQTTYIARVSANGYPLIPNEHVGVWAHEALPEAERGDDEVGSDDQANWYTTADGQYLVFGSNQDITGYDSTKAPGVTCEGLYSGGARPAKCVELYRYDATDGGVVCVSCGLPGVPPVDNAQFARSAPPNPAGSSPRPISEDGEYVLFDTASALVPQASPGEIHVYEWHDGTVSLLSAPRDPASSFFMGSSADGSNVFIGTHAQLVPQDTDVAGDLYDVRIDGGLSAVTQPVCTGTGCQGVPAAPPIFATPSSVTFEGVGNFPPPTSPGVKPGAKGLTKAQKLRAALKACKRERVKRKRAKCEAQARAKYARAKQSAAKSNRGGK